MISSFPTSKSFILTLTLRFCFSCFHKLLLRPLYFFFPYYSLFVFLFLVFTFLFTTHYPLISLVT